jgi:Rps23 Pro-64 3,4-dihydroxylase Tpa1-like proline 4-hydroxylase
MGSEIGGFFDFDAASLIERAARLSDVYRNASPFPHVVIDDFLPRQVIDAVLGEFPNARGLDWQRFRSTEEVKLASNEVSRMGPATRHLLAQFNSSAMCGFLERLTGIGNVIPDPHFVGGGLHQIESGGLLKVHADFNWHERLQLYRRLNLLLYLNDDWHEEYGGHLELWDRAMEGCAKRVLPVANRCVVFSTTSTSYHGHPTPLTCPADRTRKSMALYYYTSARDEEIESEAHSTLFQVRPRSGDKRSSMSLRSVLLGLTPPLVADGLRAVRERLRGASGR